MRSIEHGTYITDSTLKLMKERGTYLVPTVYLEDWLLENYQRLGLTPNMVEKMKIVLPIARQNVSHAFQQGVKVAFGTDAAVYPHGLNAHEFGVMVRMGMTPLASIQAATVNAADDERRRSGEGSVAAAAWPEAHRVQHSPRPAVPHGAAVLRLQQYLGP